MATKEEMQRAKSQALAEYKSIKDMMERLTSAKDDDEREEIEQEIHESPLEVSVRGGWHGIGEEEEEPQEYLILLSTGGPAVRITGELSRGEPSTARLEYQDWFTPWVYVHEPSVEEEVLLDYARQFYFGV